MTWEMENTPTRHKHDFFSPNKRVLWERGEWGLREKAAEPEGDGWSDFGTWMRSNNVVYGAEFRQYHHSLQKDYDLKKRLEVLTRLILGNVRLVAEFLVCVYKIV